MNAKNLFLTAIITIAISCPAFADIAANAPSADCDNGTLGTYQGESTLSAQWTANTINLKWYTDSSANNGTEIQPANNAAISCEYDSSITLPTNTISKPGYTFNGWRVRTSSAQPQQTPITLSTLYSSDTINVFSSKSLNPGVYCEGSSGYDSENDEYLWYGTDEGGSCSDSAFSGLNNGEWTVTMPNGNIVKGEARCSTVNETVNETGNPTDDLDLNNLSNGAQYCWCKVTSGNTGSGFQPVSSSSWVFNNDFVAAFNCAGRCAYNCAAGVNSDDEFRRALFGVTE